MWNFTALSKSARALDSMQHDQIILLSAFILQCHKKKLSPHLTVRLISKLKYAAQVRIQMNTSPILTLTKYHNLFAELSYGPNIFRCVFQIETFPQIG